MIRTLIDYPDGQETLTNMQMVRKDYTGPDSLAQALADAAAAGETIRQLWPTQQYANHDDDVAMWEYDYILYSAGQPAADSWYNSYITTGVPSTQDPSITLIAPVAGLAPVRDLSTSSINWWVVAAVVAGAYFLSRGSKKSILPDVFGGI